MNTPPSAKERYELLIKARNFHYENYNKWMTYFYVAIAALFVAFYTIASKTDTFSDKELYEKAILSLGYIVSILWYWSSKGYYYWNINFISLVNYYEEKIFKWQPEDRVYNVFANKKKQNNYLSPISGANISTSKVAILFAFIVSSFWGILLIHKVLDSNLCCCRYNLLIPLLISPASVAFFSALIPEIFLKSKIDDLQDLKLK